MEIGHFRVISSQAPKWGRYRGTVSETLQYAFASSLIPAIGISIHYSSIHIHLPSTSHNPVRRHQRPNLINCLTPG